MQLLCLHRSVTISIIYIDNSFSGDTGLLIESPDYVPLDYLVGSSLTRVPLLSADVGSAIFPVGSCL